jgi:hypothetical protein
MQSLDTAAVVVCKFELRDFKENMGQSKSKGQDSKRDYGKEKLRENIGQSKS